MLCCPPLLPCLACLRSSPTYLKEGRSSPSTRSSDIPAQLGKVTRKRQGPTRAHTACAVSSLVIFKSKCHSCQRAERLSSMILPAHPLECEIHVGDLVAYPGAGGGAGAGGPSTSPPAAWDWGSWLLGWERRVREGRVARLCRILQDFRDLPWNISSKGGFSQTPQPAHIDLFPSSIEAQELSRSPKPSVQLFLLGPWVVLLPPQALAGKAFLQTLCSPYHHQTHRLLRSLLTRLPGARLP